MNNYKGHRLQPAIDVTPNEENVILIAAAPALLEAAQAVMSTAVYPRCERCNTGFALDGDVARQLRAAIALATGATPDLRTSSL